VLIDDLLPRFDAVERHSTVIRAPRARVYDALRTTDFAASPIVRLLLGLRALPAAVAAPRRAWRKHRAHRRHSALTLASILEGGFVLLADAPGEEVVLGAAGRFWTARGARCALDAARFRKFDQPGSALAAWNFTFRDVGGGITRVSTETRVRCTDNASRRLFRAYWLFVRPFSGLIRRLILRELRFSVEQEAERA
jgi:hypothetical protein